MDARVHHQSTRNNKHVPLSFFLNLWLLGPDLVFFIRIRGRRTVPVFVRLKLHQRSSSFSEEDWEGALSTVSAPKISRQHLHQHDRHLPKQMDLHLASKKTDGTIDTSGVQQVVIIIGDSNFGEIFPKEHVEFKDNLKNAGKRTAVDEESYNEDRSKKQRS